MTRNSMPEWLSVIEQANRLREIPLSTLLSANHEFGQSHQWSVGPLFWDANKQRMDSAAWQALLALAEAVDIKGRLQKQFSGELVNSTEKRAAWHTVLRSSSAPLSVKQAFASMEAMVTSLHDGERLGFSGLPIQDVVSIGVGGAELGPAMVCEALREFSGDQKQPIAVHFVGHGDSGQYARLLARLNPATTLFLISSKSFTTADTLSSAKVAIEWLEMATSRDLALAHHVIGISAVPERMTTFGIPKENQLPLWDWVGGRFSLWSVVGMPIALCIGMQRFYDLLAGAALMDEHVASAPYSENLAIRMALVGVWNATFLALRHHLVLPYDARLSSLPNFLAQLDMESNGKSVSEKGEPIAYPTSPVVFGELAQNAQHDIFQLLHQGTQPMSCELIAVISPSRHASPAQCADHQCALMDCIAQSHFLGVGTVDESVSSFQRCSGNQVSSTLLIDELNPRSLGMLLALYEHKVSAMAVLWGINPFDQWGVEQAKEASRLDLNMLSGSQALLARIGSVDSRL